MRLFVWDFHGVLEKGNEFAVRKITNKVLTKHGYKRRMSEKECFMLYGKKWFEYFTHLLPKENLETWMKLQQECVKTALMNPEVISRTIQINNHGHEVLSKISESHDQILISNSQPISLRMFLKVTGVGIYFKKGKVLAVNAHRANNVRTKRKVLEDYLVGKKFEKIIVVGDSPSDMELGFLSNSVTYLYTHPGLRFRDVKADFKIHDLRDILREV